MEINTPQSFGRTALGYLAEIVRVVIISLAIILPIRYFLIQPFIVRGASMEPNFYELEYLIVDEISYRFSEPDRGEIVVFQYPSDRRQVFIKRIIGMPGETVVVQHGKVFVQSETDSEPQLLDESEYLHHSVYTSGDKRITLGEDEYYALGDNRSSSLDSRSFGPISSDHIIGRVWVRGWPFNKISLFETPLYEGVIQDL